MSRAAILAYGAALPRLRLAAAQYRAAWGQCAASGLKRKAFCAYDEDAVTLAVAAARQALDGMDPARIGAIFLGATTLPYEEKPSTATVATALGVDGAAAVHEIRGSPSAGVQALSLAADWCAARPERLALAIAADAPSAEPDTPAEHGFGAGAAAFVVGAGAQDTAIAAIGDACAVTIESFGARFRRRGSNATGDLELRTRDAQAAASRLAALAGYRPADRLALGIGGRSGADLARILGGQADDVFPGVGDAGAASAALGLVHWLDAAEAAVQVNAVGLGSGAYCLALAVTGGPHRRAGLADRIGGGEEVDYVAYLRHRRVLSSRLGDTA